MASTPPESERFISLATSLADVVQQVRWPLVQSSPKNSNALMAMSAQYVEDRTLLPPETSEAVKSILGTNPAAKWLTKHDSYTEMQKSLQRKAKSVGKRYADPRAEVWVTIASAWGIWSWLDNLETGTKPTPPAAKDWRAAVAAAKTLRELQRKDVELSYAFRLRNSENVPFDWIDQLLFALEEAEKTSRTYCSKGLYTLDADLL